MTKTIEAQIIEDYTVNNLKLSEIQANYHVSSKTISRIIKENNIEPRQPRQGKNITASFLYNSFLNGNSIENLSSCYGLSKKDLKRIISKERKKQILSQHSKNIPVTEIATRNKVSETYIYQVLNQANPKSQSSIQKDGVLASYNFNPDEIIHDYVCSAMKFVDIYKKHNIGSSILRRILSDSSTPSRRKNKTSAQIEKNIVFSFLNNNVPLKTLAKDNNLSIPTIRNILRKHGAYKSLK